MNESVEPSQTSGGFGRMAAILDMADDAIYDVSLDGRILHWNAAARELFGYTDAEVLGKPVTMLIPPAAHGEELSILNAVRRGERVRHYQTVRVSKSGRAIEVSISVTPLRDAQGVIVGAIKIARDVTVQKTAEARLREREERMRAIVDGAVDAIITFDEQGIIDSCNPATERLFGWSPTELIGRNVSMMMPETHRGGHDGYLRDFLRTGVGKIIGIGRDVTAVRKDGTLFPLPSGRQ